MDQIFNRYWIHSEVSLDPQWSSSALTHVKHSIRAPWTDGWTINFVIFLPKQKTWYFAVISNTLFHFISPSISSLHHTLKNLEEKMVSKIIVLFLFLNLVASQSDVDFKYNRLLIVEKNGLAEITPNGLLRLRMTSYLSCKRCQFLRSCRDSDLGTQPFF